MQLEDVDKLGPNTIQMVREGIPRGDCSEYRAMRSYDTCSREESELRKNYEVSHGHYVPGRWLE